MSARDHLRTVHHCDEWRSGLRRFAGEYRPIRDDTIDRAGNSRITQLGLSTLVMRLRHVALSRSGFDLGVFGEALQILEMFIRDLVLILCLSQIDLSFIHILLSNRALPEQFLQ